MPIALPDGLPARRTLHDEGIDVTGRDEPRRLGRPLRICLVNLMPDKIATETQFARLLGAAAVPVELVFSVPDSYSTSSAPPGHMAAFYRPWSRVSGESLDGLIVTGAPIETLPFEAVTYWSELCDIFDHARSRGIAGFYVCWAAQAALRHFHGVPKHELPAKVFGVFRHRVLKPDSPLLRGFGTEFPTPVSRHTEIRAGELPAGVTVLANSTESGLCLVEDRANHALCMFNHLEYDAGTLAAEFHRDRRAGSLIDPPRHYFPDDDPERAPDNSWRPHAHLLFSNWLSGIAGNRAVSVAEDPLIQLALASPRELRAADTDRTDLLISAGDRVDTLPGALRSLADLGIAPRAIKVHRRAGQLLIEMRTDGLPSALLAKAVRCLGQLPAIARIAYRSGRRGGWRIGGKITSGPSGPPARAA